MEGEEAEGKEEVIPELVGEAPEGAIGTEDGGAVEGLKEEEVLEEDFEGVDGANVGDHVVVVGSGVEGWSEAEVDGEGVPEGAEEEAGEKDDPEAHEAVDEVGGPAEGAALQHAEDAGADEVAAEDEEEDDGLIPGRGEEVGEGEPGAVGGELGVVDEEEVAPVLERDEESGEAAEEIEQDGGVGPGEDDFGLDAGYSLGVRGWGLVVIETRIASWGEEVGGSLGWVLELARWVELFSESRWMDFASDTLTVTHSSMVD